MATTATVAARKRSLLSSKNEAKPVAKDGIESHRRTQVEGILSKCQETNPDRVFEVDLHSCKLTRMENFQSFTKLRILDLSCNQIKVIRALDKNLELKELKLYSNRIVKIEGLEKLRELCSLQLQDNKISKLDNGLLNLKKLQSLRLDCNEILSVSMSEIAACSKLTYLDVSRNKLEDISFVNALPLLNEFKASHNKLVKIPDLGRCKKLQDLDLSYNRIPSLSGVNSLTAISVLRLEHNIIKNLDVSGVVKSLEELYLGGNQLGNLRKLATQFPSIEVLDVGSNALNNLDEVCSTLQDCHVIRELIISDNPWTGTDSLCHQRLIRSLPALEVLDGTPVKRPQSSHGKTRPPMRPVSASQMLSMKQLEEQVSAAIQEQDSFKSLISSKFSIVYDLLNKLPEKSTDQASCSEGAQCSNPDTTGLKSQDSPRPVSRCGNRARIHDAIAFAEQHFDES